MCSLIQPSVPQLNIQQTLTNPQMQEMPKVCLFQMWKPKTKDTLITDNGEEIDVIGGPQGLKTKINPFILLIPSTFDLASSILSFFALL